MAKKYLNRAEKGRFYYLSGLIRQVEKEAKEMETLKADPELVEKLKDAIASITLVQNAMIEGLDARELQKLLEESERYEIATIYKRDINRILREFEEKGVKFREEVNAILANDPIHGLSEKVMVAFCASCDGTPCTTKEGCPIFNDLSRLDIEPWDVDNEKCIYAYAGVTDVEKKTAGLMYV